MYRPRGFPNLEIGLQSLTRRQLEHHLRLYVEDVRRANALVEQLAALRGLADDDAAVKRAALRRHEAMLVNGLRLHELFFEALGQDERVSPELGVALQAAGGKDRLVADLRDATVGAGALAGNGWSLLVWDPARAALRVAVVHEHHVGIPLGCEVLLAIDAWEHAYFTDYGPEREAYASAVLRDVSWPVVSSRLAACAPP